MSVTKALALAAAAIAAGLVIAVGIQFVYEMRNAFNEWTDATA